MSYARSSFLSIDPKCEGTEIIQFDRVNILVHDALAPWARTLAPMTFTT